MSFRSYLSIVVLFPASDMKKVREKIPSLGQQGKFHDSKAVGCKRMVLQLPSGRLLRELAEYQTHSEMILSSVDVACDVSCENYSIAVLIQKWLAIRYRQRWLCSQRPRTVVDTFYTTGRLWNDKSVVMYADKPSKVTSKPCAHFELRIRGAGKVRACGIENLQALAALNLVEFMYGQLHFEEIRYEAMGRVIRGRSMAKKPDIKIVRLRNGRVVSAINLDLRAGYMIARLCAGYYLDRRERPIVSDLEFELNDIPAMLLRIRLIVDYPAVNFDSVFRRLDSREIFDIQLPENAL